MEYTDRSRRVHFLLQYIPRSLEPEIVDFFGELIVRVRGQMCLVVTLEGEVGVRATDASMQAEMSSLCGERHWVSQGRLYDRWYLLPDDLPLNQTPVTDWIAASANSAALLANWRTGHRMRS